MARHRQHLRQVADLRIRAEILVAYNYLDKPLRKFFLQPLYDFDGGIVGIADPENDLVFRIILKTVAPQSFVDLRIDSFQRLENRDRRGEKLNCSLLRLRDTLLAQK